MSLAWRVTPLDRLTLKVKALQEEFEDRNELLALLKARQAEDWNISTLNSIKSWKGQKKQFGMDLWYNLVTYLSCTSRLLSNSWMANLFKKLCTRNSMGLRVLCMFECVRTWYASDVISVS